MQILKKRRIAIKHGGDTKKISGMFDGKLNKYLKDESILDDLSFALKIALNSTYGLTSARLII